MPTTPRPFAARSATHGAFRRATRLAPLIAATAAIALACSSGEPAAPPAPSVRVLTVTPRPTVAFEEYVARIASSNTVEIRPQVEGRLETQSAVEGQRVEKGALLFMIDPEPYAAALARAQADQAQAEARRAQSRQVLERVKRLASSNVASEQALDAAVAEEKDRKSVV